MDIEYNTYNIQELGLAKALVKKGHVCDIIFWTENEEKKVRIEVEPGKAVNVFYCKSRVLLKNAIFKNIDQIVEKYDILQPCEYNQLQSVLLAKKYADKTIIYHGPYFSKFNKKYNLMCKIFDLVYLKHYIKGSTKFIVKSNLAAQFLINKGIKKRNITIAGVGINIDALIPDINDKPDFVKKVEKLTFQYKILYIGKIEKRRNIKFLLQILKYVYEQGFDTSLILVGDGEREYIRECFEFADELGISSRLIWSKKLEQKYLSYLYKTCDLFLLPTSYEIFGMVLLEAMYYSLPVITTQNGGSDTLIQSGINGIVLELDIQNWGNEVIRLFQNRKETKNLGEMAHKTILENYTWDKLSLFFLDAYKEKLGDKLT